MRQYIESKTLNQFDNALEEIQQRWELPGLAIGIVEQSEITFLKTTGVQNLDTNSPVTADSLFCMASIAKPFVASAVMRLVENGLISLDHPIQDYLPYFKLADERASQISLRQILSHTSGIPDMDEMTYIRFWKNPEMDAGAAERYVRGLANLELVHPPGEQFLYSNIAYNVAGDLIAKVSGMSFETYLRQNILIPAGMADSTFLLEEVPTGRLAVPHLRVPEMIVTPTYPFHRADGPSSNLHASILDMCRWGEFCLEKGKANGQQVLQPASFETMWTPIIKRTWPPLYLSMGLAWNQGSFQGYQTISHGGGGAGINAFLLLLPDLDRAAVMLCNAESEAHYNLIDAMLAALSGCEPQAGKVDWMVPICQALGKGGREAAFEIGASIQTSEPKEYEFYDQSLIGCVYQMIIAGRFTAALDLLDLTTHFYPDNTYAIFLRAQVYLEMGELDMAQKDLQRVLEIEPRHSKALGLLVKKFNPP